MTEPELWAACLDQANCKENHHHEKDDLDVLRHRRPPMVGSELAPTVLTSSQMNELLDVLLETTKFLVYRDRMNAALHCAEVKWSPLTDRVHDAMHMLNRVAVDEIKQRNDEAAK